MEERGGRTGRGEALRWAAAGRAAESRELGESGSLGGSAGGGGPGSRWGEGLRRLEAGRGGAKDCSNGFGSRSKSERFCLAGRRGDEREGDWLFGDMTHDRRLNHAVTMGAAQ